MSLCAILSTASYAAFLPPLLDCAEVYAAGGTEPGFYYLLDDVEDSEDGDIPVLHYCEDGWTTIFARDKDDDGNYVTVPKKKNRDFFLQSDTSKLSCFLFSFTL